MGDSWASSEGARLTMKANRRRDTQPELRIRRILHSRGLRYRADFAPGEDRRRRADIVFTRARIAVFVDGCFWHGCPEHFIPPKSNPDYWGSKIEKNRRRDAETTAHLRDAGWTVMRFWEHEDPAAAAEAIIDAWTVRRR
ncbi:very short patch repair endonuclease [Brevibacterium jeotgali]|uniref:very short patch repair endonuclease n=1 Tax=Brevibacterium jeotgali TaxID=1262550 RepID=UPI000C76E5D7|nr:very short patch repair endonuclease [Brevibacterium jeotgali]